MHATGSLGKSSSHIISATIHDQTSKVRNEFFVFLNKLSINYLSFGTQHDVSGGPCSAASATTIKFARSTIKGITNLRNK